MEQQSKPQSESTRARPPCANPVPVPEPQTAQAGPELPRDAAGPEPVNLSGRTIAGVQGRAADRTPVPARRDKTIPPRPLVRLPGHRELVAELLATQNFCAAVAAGFTAAVVGVLLWTGIAIATNCLIGWMAIGIGYLVGGVVRIWGRGLGRAFGYLAAAMSVCSCLLGMLLSTRLVGACREGQLSWSVLARPAGMLYETATAVRAIDLLFVGIAAYVAYRSSRRKLTKQESDRIIMFS